MAKTVKTEEPKTDTTAKYRYFCHGCTKPVYYSSKVEVGVSVTCPHCGKTQVTKEENFIAL